MVSLNISLRKDEESRTNTVRETARKNLIHFPFPGSWSIQPQKTRGSNKERTLYMPFSFFFFFLFCKDILQHKSTPLHSTVKDPKRAATEICISFVILLRKIEVFPRRRKNKETPLVPIRLISFPSHWQTPKQGFGKVGKADLQIVMFVWQANGSADLLPQDAITEPNEYYNWRSPS